MITSAVRVSDLCCVISGRRILDSVSIEIGAGSRTSVLGPNGAGKTTLLKCLMRIVRPSGGRIEIMGEEIGNYSRRRLARRIGYVSQNMVGEIPFTVEEFVLLGRYPHLSPFSNVGRDDMAIAAKALESTETSHLSGRMFETLSGGERQMVLIAAVLAQGAEILLLDEPAAFLDPRHASRVDRILEDLNRRLGLTVISVTHDVNNAILAGDRVLVLKSGSVLYSGEPTAMTGSGILEEAFGKTFIYGRHPVTGTLITIPDAIRK